MLIPGGDRVESKAARDRQDPRRSGQSGIRDDGHSTTVAELPLIVKAPAVGCVGSVEGAGVEATRGQPLEDLIRAHEARRINVCVLGREPKLARNVRPPADCQAGQHEAAAVGSAHTDRSEGDLPGIEQRCR
jgi:hypothetical protein